MRLLTGRVAAGRPAFCVPGRPGEPAALRPAASFVKMSGAPGPASSCSAEEGGSREPRQQGSRTFPGVGGAGAGGGWCGRPVAESDIRLDQTISGPPLELLL